MTNNLNIIFQKYKPFIGVSLFILVIVLLVIFNSPTKVPSISPITEPVIPSSTPIRVITPTTILNAFPKSESQQTLSFTWNNHTIDQYKEIKLFSVTSPLIRQENILRIADLLGFKDTDKKKVLKKNNYRWGSDNHTFFASVPQDQMFYASSIIPSSSIQATSDEKIKSNIFGHLTTLFGNAVANNLTPNSDIRLYKITTDLSGMPNEVSASKPEATIYEMSFRQTIEDIPVVALSGTADIVTISIDRSNTLVKFSVYGGLSNFKQLTISPSITTQQLKNLSPTKAIRITSAGSVSMDEAYMNADQLSLSVNKIELAYLQEGLSLHPVYLLYVDITGKDLVKTSGIYSVSALP